MNALSLKDPGSDDEAGAPDPALVPDPAGEDELSKPLCELPVAEQAKNETEMKVCNLSIFHVNAVSPIIIDGAGQGFHEVCRPQQSEPRLVIIGRRTRYCGITLDKGSLDALYRNHLRKHRTGGRLRNTSIC